MIIALLDFKALNQPWISENVEDVFLCDVDGGLSPLVGLSGQRPLLRILVLLVVLLMIIFFTLITQTGKFIKYNWFFFIHSEIFISFVFEIESFIPCI